MSPYAELILGLPTMKPFDLMANDISNSFQSSPDLTAYTVIELKQSMYDASPPLNVL